MADERPRAVPRVHPRTLALAAAGVAVVVLAAAVLLATQQEHLHPAGADASTRDDVQFLDLDGAVDTDRDGLSDATENYITGTDPTAWSSNGGPIPDGWLHHYGYDPLLPGVEDAPAAAPPATAVPAAHGPDGRTLLTPTLWDVYSFNRLSSHNESVDGPWRNGIDPRDWDQNDDGIPDGFLLRHGLDPALDLRAERLAGPTGFTVAEAYEHNTDPTRLDTDGDGIADTVEVAGGPLPGGFTFPPTDPSRYDSNGAGVCDGFLAHQGIDPHDVAAARGDGDNDGATAVEEFQWSLDRFGDAACRGERGLSLSDATSGASAIPDGWLIRYGLDPLQSGVDGQVTQKVSTDPGPDLAGAVEDAEDGLTVLDEYLANRPGDWDEGEDGPWWGGTDPTKVDTDGDGLGDAWELRGYTILVATDVGPGATATAQAVLPDPTRADTDGDGIGDGDEAGAQPPSDATRRDTDLDGLPDGFEADTEGLDPLRADSAGDYLRDGDRHLLLTGRAAAYGKDLSYACPGTCLAETATAWLEKAVGAQDLLPLDAGDVVQLVGPDGDVDGDGLANLVDADMDGDGLPNGVEVDPSKYSRTSHGLGPLGSRPATDPLNRDTDGDRLVDSWEVQHGRVQGARYDLDPSDWDTDGDGVDDGGEDPDEDSIEWLSFGGPTVEVNLFPFRNVDEQQYGTDPHAASSDGDGLLDGWKVFWGQVYPGLAGALPVPPDATVPTTGVPQPDALITQRTTERRTAVADEEDRLLDFEATLQVIDGVPTGSGGTRTLYVVGGPFPYTLQLSQALGTNPYATDTDLDGLPDAWEAIHSSAPPDPECAAAAALDPAAPDADGDVDGDGLSALREFQEGLHPLCPDTDHGTLPDGEEARLGMDPLDHLDDLAVAPIDQDGDGVLDIDERRFLGTDPLNPDTDGDGLLDGRNVPQSGSLAADDPRTLRFLDQGVLFQRLSTGRYVFQGEQDILAQPRPLDADPLGIGVPQGWLLSRGLDPGTQPADPATVRAAYQIGIPSWWDESAHGPWWGGATKAEMDAGATAALAAADLDGDGLGDRLGEDPLPAANHCNLPRAVDATLYQQPESAYDLDGVPSDPRAPGLDPMQERLAAQALLEPRHVTSLGLQRETEPAVYRAGCDHEGRHGVTLAVDVPDQVAKGTPFPVEGSLTRAGGVGVAGVTVVATIADQPVGVGVTDASGDYAIQADITGQHTFTIPSHALVVLGETQGTVTFTADTGAVDLGPQTVRVRSYATPETPPHTDGWDPVQAATATAATTVVTDPRLSLQAPEAVKAGDDVVIVATVTDGSGDPLGGRIRITTPTLQDTQDVDGAGAVSLTVPTGNADAGRLEVTAHYLPPSNNPYVGDADAETAVQVRVPSDLTLDALPPGVAGGQTLTVRGQLTSPLGPVFGADVRVTLDGTQATTTTDPEGGFVAELTLPDDQAPGEAALVASAAATDTTLESSTSASTIVLGRPRLQDQSPAHLSPGEPIPIRGVISAPDGTPLADATVHYRIGDKTGSTKSGADGVFAASVDWTPPAGPSQQELTFKGDAVHAAVSTKMERFAVSATFLEVDLDDVARGANLTVDVRLVDAAGRPVPGATLTLRHAEAGSDLGVTDDAGRATLGLPTAGLDLGRHEVVVAYAGSGDGSLLRVESKKSWNLFSGLEVRVGDGPHVAGGTPPKAHLLDLGTGQGVARRIQVEGADGTRTVTTERTGAFDLMESFPDSTTPRTYEWRVSAPADAAYPLLDETVSLRVVLPVDVQVRLTDRLVADQPNSIVVEVLDSLGNPASGTVHFLFDGDPVGTTTLASGRASVPVLPDAPGPAELRVVYDGSLLHASAEHVEEATVLSPTTLDVSVRSLRGGNARVDVTATGADGPIAFRTVHLSIQGLPGGVDVETDESGRASYVVHEAADGLAVSARLAAESGEEPSVVTATVGSGLPGVGDLVFLLPYLLGGVALLAVVGLGVLATVLWNRRSPLELELRHTLRSLRGRGAAEEVVLHAYYVLQRAALRRGWLEDEAATPRILQETLVEHVKRMPEKPLDALVGLFEEARYGDRPMGPPHREMAIRALTDIRRTTAWGSRA